MADLPIAASTQDGDTFDEELSILNHSVEYLNEADDRARERLLFYLTHRYFPEGSFAPIAYPRPTKVVQT